MHAVHLQCPIQGDALQAVDLGVIRARTNVRSETTQTDEDFRTKLLERDVSCVWTGVGMKTLEMVYISFPIGEAPMYVLSVDVLREIIDRLPVGCFSGFGLL